MAVPKYMYRTIVWVKNGGSELRSESHNYEVLAGAWSYRETALRKPSTRKVEIVMVLDESTRG